MQISRASVCVSGSCGKGTPAPRNPLQAATSLDTLSLSNARSAPTSFVHIFRVFPCGFFQPSAVSGATGFEGSIVPPGQRAGSDVNKGTWLVLYCGANANVEQVSEAAPSHMKPRLQPTRLRSALQQGGVAALEHRLLGPHQHLLLPKENDADDVCRWRSSTFIL